MKLRRVLLTVDAVGGVWGYGLTLAAALADRGVETILAAVGPSPSAEQRREATTIAGLRLVEHPGVLEWMDDAWASVADTGRWLREVERETRPDVVFASSFSFGAVACRAPVVVVAHSCVLSWYEAVRGVRAPPSWDRYRREVRRGLEEARCIVAPTAAMAEALRRHHDPGHTLTTPVRVIANARAASAPRPSVKEPFVLSAGRLWDDAKNIVLLDAVAPQVSWPVLVAGDATGPGGQRRELSSCQSLGAVPSALLGGYMARASVYAAPALYEPFGLAILEAASAGCALLLGDIPSLRELWDGVAVFAPPRDQSAFARALRLLEGDPRGRRALAAAARQRACRFTSAAQADAYIALARELAAERGASSVSLALGATSCA